jgi:pimeloyl-ACP methyl ester carboxylesterase
LILDAPPPLGGGTESDVPLDRYRALVRDGGMSDFRREWARHPLTQLRTHDPGAHALLSSALARYSGNDLRAAARAEASDLPARLAKLQAPILILSGQHDLPTRSDAADELARQLAAERAVIAGAGHLANLDCADAYSECCRHFLGRCAPVCHSS